jgi:nucleotidyltransferase substrate binding protein (TIGR01987 family)
MQDVRWKQRFDNFQKAYLFLKKSVQQGSYDELQAAGLVQSFGFTFELAWKTLKDYQTTMGTPLNYPREVLKEAFKAGLIADGHVWISMLDHRNELTHCYNEEQSKQALQLIGEKYFPAIEQVYQKLKSLAE